MAINQLLQILCIIYLPVLGASRRANVAAPGKGRLLAAVSLGLHAPSRGGVRGSKTTVKTFSITLCCTNFAGCL